MGKRTGVVTGWNPWNFNAEPGDIMVKPDGTAYQLEVSRGRNKAAAGELTPRELKKPGYRATIQDGKLVWVQELHNE
jgi:hypothetical protein